MVIPDRRLEGGRGLIVIWFFEARKHTCEPQVCASSQGTIETGEPRQAVAGFVEFLLLQKAPSDVELGLPDIGVLLLLGLGPGFRFRFQEGLKLLCRSGPVSEDESGDPEPIVAFRFV